MKTLRFILISSLCILFIGSCKKDNDIGGDNVHTGKVSFSEFGMKVYFPEDEWGNQKDVAAQKITAFLRESRTDDGDYSVFIRFIRFISHFEDENKANEEIKGIKDYYEASLGSEYSFVSPIESSQVSNYKASKIKCKKMAGPIEETYFIYRKNRLYQISIVMPEDKVSVYYAPCMEIINTLQITD